MTVTGRPGGQLDWLVSDFTRDTPGVRHALVVSGDDMGLVGYEMTMLGFSFGGGVSVLCQRLKGRPGLVS